MKAFLPAIIWFVVCADRAALCNTDNKTYSIQNGIMHEGIKNVENPPEEAGSDSSLSFIAPMIIEADRLMPVSVELEHRFRGPDDSTYVTEYITITLLSRHYGYEMRGMAGADIPWQAPIPMTLDQAIALIPGAMEMESQNQRWVLGILDDGECSISYYFDQQGRTIEVDLDPVADSSTYRFIYSYADSPDSLVDHRPQWIDDLSIEN